MIYNTASLKTTFIYTLGILLGLIYYELQGNQHIFRKYHFSAAFSPCPQEFVICLHIPKSSYSMEPLHEQLVLRFPMSEFTAH